MRPTRLTASTAVLVARRGIVALALACVATLAVATPAMATTKPISPAQALAQFNADIAPVNASFGAFQAAMERWKADGYRPDNVGWEYAKRLIAAERKAEHELTTQRWPTCLMSIRPVLGESLMYNMTEDLPENEGVLRTFQPGSMWERPGNSDAVRIIDEDQTGMVQEESAVRSALK